MGGPDGGRKRRSGLTTIEYALMLFFFAITSIFGFPILARTAARYADQAGQSIELASETSAQNHN